MWIEPNEESKWGVRRRVPGSLFVRRKGAWHRTGRAMVEPCRCTDPGAPIVGGRGSHP